MLINRFLIILKNTIFFQLSVQPDVALQHAFGPVPRNVSDIQYYCLKNTYDSVSVWLGWNWVAWSIVAVVRIALRLVRFVTRKNSSDFDFRFLSFRCLVIRLLDSRFIELYFQSFENTNLFLFSLRSNSSFCPTLAAELLKIAHRFLQRVVSYYFWILFSVIFFLQIGFSNVNDHR